ncbi:MAG: hypothetical protein U0930_15655 [Pirellulales bacterium]
MVLFRILQVQPDNCPLVRSVGAAVPNTDRLPGTSLGTNTGSGRGLPPANTAAGLGQNVPSNNSGTITNAEVQRLGTPTAPPPVNSAVAPNVMNNRAASNSMSDTQRGAMVPTQFADTNVPALNATLPNGMPSQLTLVDPIQRSGNSATSGAPQPNSPGAMPAWNNSTSNNSLSGNSSSAPTVENTNNAWSSGTSFQRWSASLTTPRLETVLCPEAVLFLAAVL